MASQNYSANIHIRDSTTMKVITNILAVICIGMSSILLLVNFYGFTQALRPANITVENLRFGDADVSLSQDEYFDAVKRKANESDLQYSQRLTTIISQGTAHIHWEQYDPRLFHQLVPVWENWILHTMGIFSGIPEFQRYHFANPYKSMERGIGICGDASMVMTQLLEENGIEASMLTFPGHVVVTAVIDGSAYIFDPDFGVVIPASAEQLNQNVNIVDGLYSNAGYPASDDDFFMNTYNKAYTTWDGPETFITKKFYFEKFAYLAKWLFPLLALVFGVYLVRRNSHKIDITSQYRVQK
jgi:hypothetical protein